MLLHILFYSVVLADATKLFDTSSSNRKSGDIKNNCVITMTPNALNCSVLTITGPNVIRWNNLNYGICKNKYVFNYNHHSVL